jgi:hypothetical protein
LIPSAIRLKLVIKSGGFADDNKAVDPKSAVQHLCSGDKEQGDILIRGFWARGTDAIIDVHVTDMDAKSYRSKDPHKVLAPHEKEKKQKYLASCTAQRKHFFTSFDVSTDGLLGHEATELLKRLSLRLADKWQ